MANKPKIKKERTHSEKEGEKREKTTTTLSEKKQEASISASNGTKAGYT